jgi:hypothetical protein
LSAQNPGNKFKKKKKKKSVPCAEVSISNNVGKPSTLKFTGKKTHLL